MPIRLSRRGLLAATGLTVATPALAKPGGGLRVTGLMTENLDSPMGVQLTAPRLSWRLESEKRGTVQAAYRILVASSRQKLEKGQGDLWDSGRCEGDRAFDIAYGGQPLTSRTRAWWRVTVWDNHGATTTSVPAFWEMGLLSPSDWQAKWLAAETEEMRGDRETGLFWLGHARPVAPARTWQVRLVFDLPQDGEITTLTVAHTRYALFVDGRPLTLPPWPATAFGSQGVVERSLSLAAGRHVMALRVDDLDNDWLYKTLECAFMVRARLADGTTVRFDSKNARTSTEAPDGWAAPAFDDSAWAPAVLAARQTMPFPGRGAFLLRRDFTVKAPVASARLYVTALGAHETHLNGAKVGDHVLAPESSDFRKRVLYRVHDVTALIRPGANAIGAMVGDGWYGSYLAPVGRFAFGDPPLRYLAQLELTYGDGRRETVISDETWTLSRAPVTRAEIYDGEDYDARLERPGWASAGFTGAGWTPATLAPPATGRLEGAISPPIRRIQTLDPVRATPVGDAFVLDFGQNFAGWVRLKVRGRAGDRVTLKFAEVLKPDGHIDQSNLRAARAADTYVLRGDPNGEVYEPHFTYHGFRYVEVSGLKATPRAGDVVGIAVHSDLAETGHLRVADPLIMQLWRNALWSQRSNFVGIPTDCPQRDERLGWMGDAHVFWDAAAFNMNIAAFTERWMGDVRDAQAENGAYSNVSPNTLDDGGRSGASPGWSDAGVILPWTVWRRFGDTAIIDQHWDSMVRYLDFIAAHAENHIWTSGRGNDFGDWLSLDSRWPGDDTTPKDLIATAMWKHSVDAVAEMARASGRSEAAETYTTLSATIRDAFVKTYIHDDGTISNGSQTGYILALHYNLVPDALRQSAAANLKADIDRRGMLTTGFLGTPFSLDVLSEAGYARTVYDLLLRTTYPSWGYMVAHGATTVWERWNGDTGDVSMNSYNHYALGAVTGFVFRRIAGIAPLDPGFRTFIVDPVLDPRVKSGGGDYDAMPGRISTDWTQGVDGAFSLAITVPANTTARIRLPGGRVQESGRPLAGHPDVRDLGGGLVEVGSG
ncbi:MAG: family 78 glycoside hydrolase catalytic domain, partial [Asticcacaulis sp.]|nr:family 78 glycoside hydrolase catalytic domain [Asticcacaulis sp.]